ncbi:MAG: nucleoid-associated protein [Flammeovirgaceae bacterium]|nr:nucleoid-associated protein [Flammeovirgaceae bacterium]MDW8286643.1 nucleoid-associated protein [Flammeovirgaceae bacterium]
MLNLEEVTLYSLAVHWVGNRKEGEELILSNLPIELDVGEVKRMLMRYFLSAFKEPAFFQFYPQETLAYNEVFQTVRKIFADKNTFFPASAHLAQHLYDVSTHPSIRGGEFFVAYFKNCSLDSMFLDAVGLFKAENKETLLKVYPSQDNFRLGKEEGININKLDKGCLIFNIDEENGYKVLVVDRIAKDSIAQFWKDDFLQIRQREDKFFHTHQYLHLCKGFVDDVFNAEHHIDKAEQSAMLHRTYQYFAEKDSFNRIEFENEVIQEPSVVDAFEEYKQKYEQERNLHMNDEFPIAVETVKRNKRFFRSVIKLDKNFSLYVHGDREMIERGYDQERKMMYYKLFFKEES